MSRSVGGLLNYELLAQMNRPTNPARRHFDSLSPEDKREAVRNLARQGFSDHAIAAACQLAVEQVRRVLSEA